MFCRIRQGWYGYCGQVRDLSIGWMRLWILPWSVFAIWGMSRCIQSTLASKHVVWLMLCSPVFALSHNSLMPEMPLFACILLGWQGVLSGKRGEVWALILGCRHSFDIVV